METNTARLVTFGRGGDTVYYARGKWGKTTGHGYGTPERPHAALPEDGKVFPDGTPAVDILPALETREGVRWAIQGPMVDVDLEDGAVDRCPDPSPFFAAAVSGNAFGTLLAVHGATKNRRAGALDSVNVSEYVQGWRERGARIGAYRGGKIVWES